LPSLQQPAVRAQAVTHRRAATRQKGGEVFIYKLVRSRPTMLLRIRW
jgi:hypothetical protein